MKTHFLALGTLCLTSIPLSAVTLVGYNFNSTIDGVSASAPGVVTAPLSLNTGTDSGNTGFVRSTNTPEEGAGSLAITFANLDNADAPTEAPPLRTMSLLPSAPRAASSSNCNPSRSSPA